MSDKQTENPQSVPGVDCRKVNRRVVSSSQSSELQESPQRSVVIDMLRPLNKCWIGVVNGLQEGSKKLRNSYVNHSSSSSEGDGAHVD